MNRGHKVKARSIQGIRDIAIQVKDAFNINGRYFPIVELIELMHHSGIIEFEVIEKELMPNDYGLTYPKKNKIVIREDVYDKARKGDGFGRFTMGHELGHLFLHRDETVFARNEHGGRHKTYEDSEWQADKFAQELLVDIRLLEPYSTPYQIAEQFGVSMKAANVAYESLKRKGVLK